MLVLVLEGLGGDAQAVPPSCARRGVPGVSEPIYSLGTARGDLVLLLHRDVGAGERRTALHSCCLHLPGQAVEEPRAGLGVQLGFP